MNYNPQAITVSLKICRACGISLLASHRFCRVCGASQGQTEFVTRRHDGISNLIPSTRMLAPDSERKRTSTAGNYRSISGSVLDSFVTSDLTAATSRLRSRAAKRAVAAAITIPLWLMIVLLSPLDALQASRQVTKQL
jgi:ribosomal protein L32